MAKDLIPDSRGLTASEIGKPFPKQPKFVDLSSEKNIKEPIDAPSGELFVKEIISAVKGKSVYIMSDNKKYEWNGGSLSWRNNNPGNVRYGEFAKRMGAIGPGHNGMSVFKTLKDGFNSQKELLFGPNSKYTSLTLVDAIKRYAPVEDNNNPKEYANFVANKAKINKTTIIDKLTSTQKEDMINAMSLIEGFKVGKITKV